MHTHVCGLTRAHTHSDTNTEIREGTATSEGVMLKEVS